MTFSQRDLQLDRPGDVECLQSLLEAAPTFHLLTEGRLPATGSARDLLTELPPGKTLADKQVLGFFVDDRLAGCADIVRGYPAGNIAYLGLLLFDERVQGQGYGAQALAHLAERARSWGCDTLRLAVIATNERGLRFWKRQGFVELHRKPMPAYTGDAIVMQCALPQVAGNRASPDP